MKYKSPWKIDEHGRECAKCGIYKLWSEFGESRSGILAHGSCCFECQRERSNARNHRLGAKERKRFRIDKSGRECSCCGKYKFWSEFNTSRTEKTGHTNICRECKARKGIEYRRKKGIPERKVWRIDKHGRECTCCGGYKLRSEFYAGDTECKKCSRLRYMKYSRAKGVKPKKIWRRDKHGRECTCCGVYKRRSEFYISQGKLMSRCRECLKANWTTKNRANGVKARYYRKIEKKGMECTCCRVFKPKSEFYKHSLSSTGHVSRCKSCISKANKEVSAKNRKKAGLPPIRVWKKDKDGRECIHCGKKKAWSEFYRRKDATCKECNRKLQVEYRRKRGIPKRKVYRVDEYGRECTKCGKYKPTSAFRKNGDKLRGLCRECGRIADTARRRAIGVKPKKVWRIGKYGRECTRCGKDKSWSEFAKGGGHTGHAPRCRECHAKTYREKAEQVGIKIRMRSVIDSSGRKMCTCCGKMKSLSDFNKNTAHSGGFFCHCRKCIRENRKKYLSISDNKKRIDESRKKSYKKQRKNPCFCINQSMSGKIAKSLKGAKAGRHWENLVGFTKEELVTHLESLMEPGMTWENRGKLWHIDHLIPKNRFEFMSAEDSEFRMCWRLRNLVPRWATTEIAKAHGSIQTGNIDKHDKLIFESKYMEFVSANVAG